MNYAFDGKHPLVPLRENACLLHNTLWNKHIKVSTSVMNRLWDSCPWEDSLWLFG